jgi:hypothetical protein
MLFGLLGAAASGLGLMYFLDPDQGRRRRALVRDQMVHAAHKTGDAVDATSRDLANRAKGAVAELRGRFQDTDVSDDVLRERVRARIGAVIGHAGAIDVEVTDGVVMLRGPVLVHEVERLLRRVAAVRGVKTLDDKLEVHAEPGNIPSLQGRARTPRGGEVLDFMQNNWSPTTRLVAGATGAAAVTWGLRRLDAIGLTVAALGLGLLSRAIANIPVSRFATTETARRVARR